MNLIFYIGGFNKLNKSESAMHTYNSLQLLRGVAAILVVFFHGLERTNLFHLISYGYMGVDLFFVLSGFIIFFIHYSDIGNKNKFKPFLVKRFVRVYPIYWIVTLFYLILVLAAGNIPNFDYFFKSMFLIPQPKMPILGVAWTLEFEMLFYILFSLLLLNKKFFSPLLKIWCLGILIYFIFPFIQIKFLLIRHVFNPLNLEFLFGCGIALLLVKNMLKHEWVPKVATILGVSLFIVSIINNYFEIWQVHRVLSWGIPSAVLIFGLVRLENQTKLRVPRLFIYLGNASYSIYLTHLITLLVITKVLKKFDLILLVKGLGIVHITSCILAISVGCLAHSLIEQPLMKFLKVNVVNKKKYKKSVDYPAVG
jgi:exopolysaccharide production protein ExoZ